jgi:hypothetical protein
MEMSQAAALHALRALKEKCNPNLELLLLEDKLPNGPLLCVP